MGASTLVFIDAIEDDSTCEEVEFEGELLLLCDGVLYRPVYQDDELVYEIVTEPEAGATETLEEPAPKAAEDVRVDQDGFRWSD